MISILSKAATWSPEQPFGEAFSRVFSSRLCSAQLIWTAVIRRKRFACGACLGTYFGCRFELMSM